ncbi:CPBP family intramembrane glutamic endopeptidase, partial [Streptococcus pseudopneumoniae]|uniref:CPBP family intramembrane glutamic endopeptidase n=1 Tax=Streptococcus pseudopneumoniae TaxID=257758 RepID=UPI00207A744E
FLSSKKHPLGEKRNHPGSKLRQGFWMVFRFGVNNWGLLFLINASMVEEFLYREILWNLVRKLDIRVALTSVLFALAHHPGTIIAWCLYVSLGMFLGLVRYKLDLWGSMGLHLVWNLLVYSLLLF